MEWLGTLARKRTTFGWIFFVLVAVFGRAGRWEILVGFLISLVGEILRTLAAGVVRKNETLACSGPYAWCRHPLYFGSFLISLGLSVTSRSPVVWIYFVVFFPLCYIPAAAEEENFLMKKFGPEYERYRKQTPAFLPGFSRTSLRYFSWAAVWKNREHINWFSLLGLLAIALVKHR